MVRAEIHRCETRKRIWHIAATATGLSWSISGFFALFESRLAFYLFLILTLVHMGVLFAYGKALVDLNRLRQEDNGSDSPPHPAQ